VSEASRYPGQKAMAVHTVRLRLTSRTWQTLGRENRPTSPRALQGRRECSWNPQKKQEGRAAILVAAILALPELASVIATCGYLNSFSLIKTKSFKKLSCSVASAILQLFSSHMELVAAGCIQGQQTRYSRHQRKFCCP
jgi:hypothetical protein